MMELDILKDGVRILDGPVYLANNFLTRFKGLMLKKRIEEEEGLFFTNVGRIHTSFMRFPIDVVYFDKDYKVLFVETVYPWKFGKKVKDAKHVLELNSGKGLKFNLDDYVTITSKE